MTFDAKAYYDRWRRDNPEKVNAAVRRYFQTDKGMYSHYKASAKGSGREFDLSFQEFTDLINSSCTYCGTVPALGVDRMDNDVGYVVTNCVACCAICNRRKGTVIREEFEDWILRAALHLIGGDGNDV
jgi:hypothetical protein